MLSLNTFQTFPGIMDNKFFPGKGQNNKSSGGLLLQAWLALPCGPFAEGLWTFFSCSFLRS